MVEMHARVVLGVGTGVLFREVSSVQECLHRERERFHCYYESIRKHTHNSCSVFRLLVARALPSKPLHAHQGNPN